MPKHLDRGLTLVEMLIVAALATIALTLLVRVVLATTRVSQRGVARVSLGQAATVVQTRIRTDLSASAPAGVHLWDEPNDFYLAAQPLIGISLKAEQQWSPELYLYHWNRGEGQVRRKRIDLGSVDGPKHLTLSEVEAWAQDSSISPHVLAGEVKEFHIDSGSLGAGLQQPMLLRVEFEHHGETFDFQQNLYLINGTL